MIYSTLGERGRKPSPRTLFAEAAHETCAAGAQSGDVVAVASVPALAHLGAFLPEEAQRAACTAGDTAWN